MDTRKSRSCYNLAIVKKGSRFDIVRYNNGFDREPVTILRNLDKTEINAKFQRAIKLIGSTMSLFSVFIRPFDKNQLVELVLMLEDSGIAQGDIKIQANGTVYFKMSGEDDQYVQDNIESLLRENNFDFDSDMITVSRGDAMEPPQLKKASVQPIEPVKKEVVKCFPQYFYPCTDGWDAVNYSGVEMGFDSVNLKHTLLSQLAAKKADEKVKQKIMFAITDFNFTSSSWRKMGTFSHEIITPKEIEAALK